MFRKRNWSAYSKSLYKAILEYILELKKNNHIFKYISDLQIVLISFNNNKCRNKFQDHLKLFYFSYKLEGDLVPVKIDQ